MTKQISSQDSIKLHYTSSQVADQYIKQRFNNPLSRVLHRNQLRFINQAIGAHHIKHMLEIAPGPARLTVGIRCSGVIFDNSQPMLRLAQTRLQKAGKGKNWKIQQGDAFSTPFKAGTFPLISTFRFIRHFKKADRQRLFKEMRRILKTGGLLIFDAPNLHGELLSRRGKKNPVYDKFWTKESLIKELGKNGFKPLLIKPNVNNLLLQRALSKFATSKRYDGLAQLLDKSGFGLMPLEWLVLCQKT